MLGASLEGVSGFYNFRSNTQANAKVEILASTDQVWRSLDTATSPDFPLPRFLWMFPRPVDVVVDEGVGLNANRVVKIKGREGTGFLRLRVIDTSEEHATFKVLSDDSPIAQWVAHKSLTYRVESDGATTRLTVSLEYDRLLAPAWFFNTLMGAATKQAMSVLAQDIKIRTEKI